MTTKTILDVPWEVATNEPVITPPRMLEEPQPLAPVETISTRAWARPVLVGALALVLVWLGILIVCMANAQLWAEAAVMLGVAGFPVLLLLFVAFMGDPAFESPDEDRHFTFEPYPPSAVCSPSRQNTLTGRQ